MTLEEAYSRCSPGLRYRLQKSVELLRRAERLAFRYDAENGFYLAFSGGKDSQALYHVAKLAGVKFKAYFSPTTVDPPQVIRFIRKAYPDVQFEKVEMSIYQMAIKKRILPTKKIRWCCAEFKEKGGAGKVVLTGVRHAESTQRATRKEVEISGRKFSGDLDGFAEYQEQQVRKKLKHLNQDQFSINKEQTISCIGGKDKIIISPIIDWQDIDVWDFLNKVVAVPHCELYDPPFNRHRIGCICCPMANIREKLRDIVLYPYVKDKWVEVAKEFVRGGYSPTYKLNGLKTHTEVQSCLPETLIDWWISDKPWEKFVADYTRPKLFDE